ncbi:hypothetical protein [Vibrio sp. HN007]|uniref:hypothetical protein n=1 Tax=Vibrio iocasae TaxID=3098914 RepID=UPI0035D462C3
MALPNDAPLYKAPSKSMWSHQGIVAQGVPRGDSTPSFWVEDIQNKSLATSKPWNAITAWFTIFESKHNNARNVRVALKDMDVWVLRASQPNGNPRKAKWENITPSGQKVTWAGYFDHKVIYSSSSAKRGTTENGVVTYSLNNDRQPIHGGTSRMSMDGKNVLACFVRVKAWLMPDDINKPHDVDEAKILMSIGADYYPSLETSVQNGSFANANYLPGVGGSRFQYLTTKPRWFYMATVAADDLSNVEKSSEYYQSGGKTYLTKEEWFANHPDLTRRR